MHQQAQEIRILHIRDCPNYEVALRRVDEAVTTLGGALADRDL